MIHTIELVKEDLPFLYQEVKKGNVWVYDNKGVCWELTDENKKIIAHVENQGKDYGRKVFGVLSSSVIFDGGETGYLVSYLYEDYHKQENMYNGFMKYEDGMYYIPAYVVNETWDIRESGDIVIKEHYGLVRRVY